MKPFLLEKEDIISTKGIVLRDSISNDLLGIIYEDNEIVFLKTNLRLHSNEIDQIKIISDNFLLFYNNIK